MRIAGLLIILLIVIIPHLAYCKDEPKDEPEKAIKTKTDFLLLPAIFYNPETRFGGAVGFVFYHYRNIEVKEEKPDTITIYLLYTQLNQVVMQLNSESFFFNNNFKLAGEVEITRFPCKFYDIGPNTSEEHREEYTAIDYILNLSFMKRLTTNLYIGPMYHFAYFDMLKVKRYGYLDIYDIKGSDSTMNSGFGLQLSLDRREGIFYTLSGLSLNVKGFFFRKEIESEYNFSIVSVDYRHFFHIFGEHVFAVQFMATLSFGSVPFQEMPTIGGRNMMRGYYEGRYRDKNLIALQGEYRFPIYGRFGGVLFGGVAQVAPTIREFMFYNIKAAGGGGLRFTVDKKQHINIRLDFSLYGTDFLKETYGVYFMIKEAF